MGSRFFSRVVVLVSCVLLWWGSTVAQRHPWPVKQFALMLEKPAADECTIETTDGKFCFDPWERPEDLPELSTLEADLATAASYFEKQDLSPPNLEILEVKGERFWEGPREIHPVRSARGEFQHRSSAIAAYLTYEACEAEAERSRARGLSQQGKSGEARRLMGSIDPPSIVSDPELLADNSDAVRTIALPHELMHAVQHSYENVLYWQCEKNTPPTPRVSPRSKDWFLEGMADAMAFGWLETFHGELMSDKNQPRIRGWRAYNSSLHEPLVRGGGVDARGQYHEQTYHTSSFWRYLGGEIIRMVLEVEEAGRAKSELEWLDLAIQKNWSEVCGKLMPRGVPDPKNKGKRISCEEASEYAGLYMVYPVFIAQFVQKERKYPGALSRIFLDKTERTVERGLGSRKDGCFPAKFDATGIQLDIPAVAAECVRVPTTQTGGFFVDAEVIGADLLKKDGQKPKKLLENLTLSWNGCVQNTGGILSPEGFEDFKSWKVYRSLMTGLECEVPKEGEDLLLVFSNVAPRAPETRGLSIRVWFRRDTGDGNYVP